MLRYEASPSALDKGVSQRYRFAAGSANYEGDMGRNYRQGRALSPAAAAAWKVAIERHVRPQEGSRVLDLGSGTGRFSRLLADWLGCDVIGAEPSARMRDEALWADRFERVRFVGSTAEALPFVARSFSVAWLSNVVHHFRDLRRSARELRRVLAPNGVVMIAGAFAGRLDEITLFRFFPEAREIADGFPSVAEVSAVFGSEGFRTESIQRVSQCTAGSLQELASRTQLRADTTLQSIPDAAFARGQATLERTAEAASDPVIDTLDLLVMRAT